MEADKKFLDQYGLAHHISQVKALVSNKAAQADVTTLQGTVSGLSEVVGDDSNGLVKDVAGIKDVLGTDTNGLRKDVTDLKTVVGDADNGLVKNVTDLSDTINTLGDVVGDADGGLVKEVAELTTSVGDEEAGLVKDVASLSAQLNSLAPISRTGSYNDLENKPVIPITRNDMEGTFNLVNASGDPIVEISASDEVVVINGNEIAFVASIEDTIADHNTSTGCHSDIRGLVGTTSVANQISSALNNYATISAVTTSIAGAKAEVTTTITNTKTELTESITAVKDDLEAKIARRPRMYNATLNLGGKAQVVTEGGSSISFSVTAGELDLQSLLIDDLFVDSLTPDALLWLIQNQRVTGLGGYFTYGSSTPVTVILSKIAAELDGDTRRLVLIGSKYTNDAVQARVVYKVILNEVEFSLKNSYDIMASPIIRLQAAEGDTTPIEVDFGESADKTTTTLGLKDNIYILVGEGTTIDLGSDEIDLNGNTLVIMGAGSDTSSVESLVIKKSEMEQEGGTIQLMGVTVTGENNLDELEGGETD